MFIRCGAILEASLTSKKKGGDDKPGACTVKGRDLPADSGYNMDTSDCSEKTLSECKQWAAKIKKEWSTANSDALRVDYDFREGETCRRKSQSSFRDKY